MLAVTADDHPSVAPDGPVAVLANPTAGRGRHRGLLPQVLHRLEAAGRPVRPLRAHTADEAEAACRAAVRDGVSALVAVGGDGTVHRAVQAVPGTAVPFGPVPAGTRHVIAADTGIPVGPRAAVDGIAA
ncbi:acylglycerol kinase family protein, partial [Micromonospora sp. NPDC048170]|uniref:diacylglycerol/lipid kinase family protein n=1 Tax=Micromonospora sp. NPDC048170 TaxID=3154819 RepID=UPI0033C8731C